MFGMSEKMEFHLNGCSDLDQFQLVAHSVIWVPC
jgi:hypothetical protein